MAVEKSRVTMQELDCWLHKEIEAAGGALLGHYYGHPEKIDHLLSSLHKLVKHADLKKGEVKEQDKKDDCDIIADKAKALYKMLSVCKLAKPVELVGGKKRSSKKLSKRGSRK